jgi:hypothetical protein
MADLLTRLAERAIGARPVAMPVLRPIFAAPRKLETEDVDRPPAMSEANLPRRAEQSAVPDTPPSPEQRDQSQRREASPQPRASKADLETLQPARPPQTQAAPRLTLEQVIRQIYREPQIPATPESASPSRDPNTPLAALPVRGEARDTNVQNRNEQPERPRAPVDPQMEPLLPRMPVREARRSPDSTLAQGRLPGNDAGRAGSPAPEVRVSIGRIELKAAPQSAPPARPRTSPARPGHLGLDEYLRRRRGARP